jgi:dolichyl-phosphate beta-glucosyltransferase
MPTAVVVPCYNEERRLDAGEILRLAKMPDVQVVLVDDGSSDGTRVVLDDIVQRSGGHARALALDRNCGKAEAGRQGMLSALGAGAEIVGYLDADLSTPVDEIPKLMDALSAGASAALGSRIARAGADVHRRASRHLAGRLFATAASWILEQPFYDTQCGAKLFRDTPALRDALASRFASRWAFDVELLGRLLTAGKPLPFSAFVEVPLGAWRDVGGSKLGITAMARTGAELLRVRRELKARKR